MSDANSPAPSAGSGTPVAKAIKPRAGAQRRTKADREQFLKDEQARDKARAKQDVPFASGTAPLRGGRAGRGRGTAVIERMRSDAAGGVFGSGVVEKQKRRLGVTEGYEEMLDGGEAVNIDAPLAAKPPTKSKKATKATAAREQIVEEPADTPAQPNLIEDAVSEGDESDGPRRDIERIWISSDEEEDEVIDRKGKQKAISRPPGAGLGLRPVRAPRHRPKYDEDTYASNKSKTSRRGALEPIDVDEMEVDDVEFVREVPSSLELKKKPVKKPPSKGKDLRFASETIEERSERLRVSDDNNKLIRIFTPPTKAKDDIDLGAETKEKKLFLFQFPPLTPFLIDPDAPPTDDDITEVKQEKTADGKPIKPDPTAPPPLPKDILTATSTTSLPSGFIGKLNVHASGKVTLDWGGTSMEVKLGTEVDFLQDAVLVQAPDPVVKAEGEEGDADGMLGVGAGEGRDEEKRGTVRALGQVKDKLVVVPDWARLYD